MKTYEGGFMNENKKLWKKVKKMDLGNPIITTLVGIIVFLLPSFSQSSQ